MGLNWPVYKGASLGIWEPDRKKYYASADPDSITRDLQIKRKSQHRKSRSAFSEFDLSYINDPSTLPCYQPRIAFRDVTNSTDSRTVVTALVPPEVVAVDKAPYLLRVKGNAIDEAFLLGILSSMILDWYARRIVLLSLSFHLLNNFPIPRPDVDNNPIARHVVKISGRLAAVDDRFADWAAEVGVEVGTANDPDIKQDLIHELDACVAHLYDLDEADLAVVYETFHAKTDYSERHAAVLEHFRRWSQIKQKYEQSNPDDTAGDAK